MFKESPLLFMLDRQLWGTRCFSCAAELRDDGRVEIMWPAVFCGGECAVGGAASAHDRVDPADGRGRLLGGSGGLGKRQHSRS